MATDTRANGEPGRGRDKGDAAAPDLSALTDAELKSAWEALCARREQMLRERTARNLPPSIVYEGQELPPAGTLDGDLHRLGLSIYRHELEYVTRQVEKNKKKRKRREPD